MWLFNGSLITTFFILSCIFYHSLYLLSTVSFLQISLLPGFNSSLARNLFLQNDSESPHTNIEHTSLFSLGLVSANMYSAYYTSHSLPIYIRLPSVHWNVSKKLREFPRCRLTLKNNTNNKYIILMLFTHNFLTLEWGRLIQ